VKILISGEWVDAKHIDVKRGMTFRLFEVDGTPVVCQNKIIFIAARDTYLNEDGIAVTEII